MLLGLSLLSILTTATCLTVPSPATLNSTISTTWGLPEYRCVNDYSWRSSQFYPDACRAAFEHAHYIEASHLRQKFEFLSNGEMPLTRYPRMETPRRYNMRGCTVAIVMLSFYGPDDLPGQDPLRRRYDRSVTTFEKIFRAGQFVYEGCVAYGRPQGPGWNNAGTRHSVGIFFWTTNSEMDNRISGGPWPHAITTFGTSNITNITNMTGLIASS
ncbi:hypothetical protein ACLMJK_006363 [Lecanora helva]